MARPRFRRRHGALVVMLAPEERELLRRVGDELRPVLEAGPDATDPARDRLFPRAYLDPTEEDAERDWQAVVHPELVRGKAEALAALVASLARGRETKGVVEIELAPDDAERWLGALNDARLALGTALGVTEELDWDALDPEDPATAPYAVYDWLTVLQAELVDALAT